MAISKRLDETFQIGMVLKGISAVLEIVGGVLLLFLAQHTLLHFVQWASRTDLGRQPRNFLERHILSWGTSLAGKQRIVGAVYLLAHGISKGVLVVLVLMRKYWAYPWMIGLLTIFVITQTYELVFHHFSFGLLFLTVFDVFIAYLTWREYKEVREHPGEPIVIK